VKVRWSHRAERDLYDIADYIALDDPAAALRWVQRLRERARKAARMPRAGRRVPELARDDLHEVFLGAYRIIYRVEARSIVVLTIIEGHARLHAVDE
jgi:plasmid stabilization system protein ParE